MEQKMQTQMHGDVETNVEPKKGGSKKRFGKWVKRLALLLLSIVVLLVASIVGASLWVRTPSGAQWLKGEINAYLAPILKEKELSCTLLGLRGKLPLAFEADLELADKDGLFAKLTNVRFDLGFGVSPLTVYLHALAIDELHLERVPAVAGESEKEPPASAEQPQLTPKALQSLLQEVAQSIEQLPTWLPKVEVQEIGLGQLSLGGPILGFPMEAHLRLQAAFEPKTETALPKIHFDLQECSLKAKDLDVKAELSWASGADLENFLNGALAFSLSFLVQPTSLVPDLQQQIKDTPISGSLILKGPLFKPELTTKVHLPKVEANGQHLENLNLALLSQPLNIQGLLKGEADAKLNVDLTLAGKLNQDPIHVALPFSTHLASQESFEKLFVSIGKFSLSALGLSAKGSCTTFLGEEGLPPIEGQLQAQIEDWHAVAQLMPNTHLQGRVETNVALTHSAATGQKASVTLAIPSFSMTPSNGDQVSLEDLFLSLGLEHLFTTPKIDTQLRVGHLKAGPVGLQTEAKVQGDLKSALRFALKSHGDVNAHVAGSATKASVALEKCEVLVSSALMNKLQGGGTTAAPSKKESTTPKKAVRSRKGAQKAPKTQKGAPKKKPVREAVAASGIGIRLKPGLHVAFDEKAIRIANFEAALLPAGALRVQGNLSKDALTLTAALEQFDLAAWKSVVPSLPSGRIDVRIALQGAQKNPSGSLNVAVNDFALEGLPLEPLDLGLRGQIEKGGSFTYRLDMPEKTRRILALEQLSLSGSVPLLFLENGVPTLNEKGSLRCELNLAGKLAKLWKFVPLESKVLGDVTCALKVAGTPKTLELKGAVDLAKARFEDPIYGVLLRDLTTHVDLNGKTLASGDLTGTAQIQAGCSDGMGGRFSLNGTAPLDGSKLDITAHLDHLRPLRRQDVRISLSGDVKVTGSATSPEVVGTIKVDKGAVLLANIEGGPSSVTTLPITKAEDLRGAAQKSSQEERKPAEKVGRIQLAIKCPGTFVVDGFGLTSFWQTDLLIAGPLNDFAITGEVSAVRGNLDFLNKKFTLEKGIVTLAGGNVANPLIDMLLTNTTNDFTSHIRVSGTVRKLKLSLSSEPAMPQDDVLAYILFGRKANELGRYEALQLAQAMARLALGLGGGFEDSRKALGVDVLRVKSADTSSSKDQGGMSSMAVETGKYLTDSIYVGVEQGAKEGSSAGTIQLEITPRLKLELRSQQQNSSGSLNWKYSY